MSSISPIDIYNYLDTYVVGQEQAKKIVANAMFLHFVKFFYSFESNTPVTPKKSNLALAGPSGCGKTLLISKGAEALQELSGYDIAPVLSIDGSSLTAEGWEGNGLNDLLMSHYDKFGKNQAEFSSSIVFIDEFDKLCIPLQSKGGADHNKYTQYNILKAVEGHRIDLPKRGRSFSTDRMMFVFAGNWPDIRKERALANKPSMGFTDTKQSKPLNLHKELEKAGMVTQLVGRISTVAEIHPLTKKELRNTITKIPNSVYKEMQDIFKFLGKDLELSNYYINKLVDRCYSDGTGARGLQAALEDLIQDEIFESEYRF